jgi:hypothetical protein
MEEWATGEYNLPAKPELRADQQGVFPAFEPVKQYAETCSPKFLPFTSASKAPNCLINVVCLRQPAVY